MSKPVQPARKLWPRYARSPEGERARFDCMGDVPHRWKLEEPLPGLVLESHFGIKDGDLVSIDGGPLSAAKVYDPPKPRRGRPPKVAA